MALKLATLVSLTTPVLSQTVSIFRAIPPSVNQCVRPCLFRPNNPSTDLGDVLECGTPYQEDCFCPTDNDKAELVSQHIDSCAQASCSRDDVTRDAETMRSYYASYCMGNGYTADLMEDWYTNTEPDATTTTARAVWGWATPTGSRARLFGDDDSTATVTTTLSAATSDDGRNPDGLPDLDMEGDGDSSGVSPRVELVLMGFPLLAMLIQWA
ncbi:hypothetical protein F66182_3321 [Fusarium sp. NRRL 66182]|nr:hypothetical protein F66182_3321 [Fusarium sp. NRRL 66182]